MSDEFAPLRFIAAEIEVRFDRPPPLSKKPGPPQGFFWEGQEHRVREVLGSWSEYNRRGRMARNMQPAHLATTARRGSWGVGRFYFRVLTEEDRVFDLYYDRAPEDADDRTGHWFLFREMASK